MNDSKIAAKLRAQLKKFLGELLPHFSRPKVAFLGDMFYGLMAGGDVKLSKICRAYRPNITMKKAGDRLCMTWIGNSDKRDILAKAITDASLRIHELPDFHFYAIAEGIKMILSRCGRWTGFDEDPDDDEPDLFKFFDCDDRVGRKSKVRAS